MVPHVRIEEELARLLSQGSDDDLVRVCVSAIADAKKGEKLIVLHLPTEKTVEELSTGLREAGLPNLFIPARDAFKEVDAIPMLGTGKLDLQRAKELAGEL